MPLWLSGMSRNYESDLECDWVWPQDPQSRLGTPYFTALLTLPVLDLPILLQQHQE